MRRGVVLSALLLLVAASVVAAPTARAAVQIDATTFATDAAYCGDGAFTVNSTLEVETGTSTFAAGGCQVAVSDGGKLVLLDVDLSGTFFAVGGNGPVRVIGSTVTTSGAISFDMRSGNDSILVEDSTLRSTVTIVWLQSGTSEDGGKTVVKDSTLQSGGGTGDDIRVSASAPAFTSKGKVAVTGSSLLAAGAGLQVLTGSKGKTTVTDNQLAYSSALIQGGSKCKSVGNTPATPCS